MSNLILNIKNIIPMTSILSTSPKLISLSSWIVKTYGEDAPTIVTVRRWARNGLIDPRPTKHGREYFVSPAAVYSKNK